MRIPFVGGAYKDRSVDYNAQVCMNLYPVIDPAQAKAVSALYPTPGMKPFSSTGIAAEVRGLCVMDNILYAVVGNTLYRIDSSGRPVAETGTLSETVGPVFIEHNGLQLMIVEPNIAGYTFTPGGSVTEISDTDFPTPSSLTFMDGYFIVTKAGSGQFMISQSYDGTSWDATDFATAEGSPDDAVVVKAHLRQLWLLGKETSEIWYDSGATDFPFERISGVFIDIGIGAASSLAEIDSMLLFLDDNKRVVRTEGYSVVPVSTQAIEYWISKYTRTDDAIGYGYKQEGHSFYVLTFPSGGHTWVYDLSTGLWHERGAYLPESGTEGRHRSNCYAYFANKHIVGDMANGNLYELNMDYYKDGDETLRRRRASPVIHNDRRRIVHDQFEVDFESGVGLSIDDADLSTGTDPQAMLRWSNDGGHTWGDEFWTDIGEIGDYKARSLWRRLGVSRNRVYELIISDPVKTIIVAAHLRARVGSH